jgi:hypothetical protein
MTDTARNELAHKLGGTFGATVLPALNAPLGGTTSAADGTFEPRHVPSERVVTERTGRFSTSEPRAAGEPESGIHPAMNPAATSVAEVAPVPASPTSTVDLVLVSVIESQVPPGWISPADELSQHELTVIVRGSQGTRREEDESLSGPVEALMLRPGVRREERNAGEVDLHRLRISFHWRNAPAELPEMVQDTCGRLHEIASWLVAERGGSQPHRREDADVHATPPG